MSSTFRIEANDLTISTIYRDFYTVPDFQREYVWEDKDVEKLLQDVLDEFYDEKGRIQEGPEYFLGSIVVCKNEEGTFQLIDGQQRMTTIYLVLCAARDVLVEVESSAPQWLDKQISDVYADPRTGGDIRQLRLTLQYEDSNGILDHVAKGNGPIDRPFEENTESVRRICGAYHTIRDRYRIDLHNNPDEIKKFLVAFTSRIKLIRIVTPSLANALKVFETINDRGVGLNAMDLLKNRLFMQISSRDYSTLKKQWKTLVDTLDGCQEKQPLRFLRYYIMAHHRIRRIREDEIYEWFINHTDECRINADPLGFANTLIECAKAYANFLKSKNITGEENRYLQNIALLGRALRQHYILLLAARNFKRQLFDRLCEGIENLLFCYIIARERPQSYERKFAQWSENLRVVNNEANLNEFMRDYFYPDMHRLRNEFDFRFKELDSIDKYLIRYILAKLSQSVEEAAWGNPTYTRLDHYIAKEVELEHILPQSPPDNNAFDRPEHYGLYVKKLGNLTLLEKTINSSIRNLPYSRKCQGYRQSSFLLTKSLVERPQVGVDTRLNRAVEGLKQFTEWNTRAIDERQKMLLQLARAIWSIPEPDSEAESE